MSYSVGQYIDGKIIDSENSFETELFNPATGKTVGVLQHASSDQVALALESSERAFNFWSEQSLAKRTKLLFNYQALLKTHTEKLAKIISQEHGKTLEDAKGSVQRGIDVVEFACGLASHLGGSFTENIATGVDGYSLRQPVGICLGITPFNFPAMIALWMFPIAVMCGNVFILKPSEKDPSCALLLASLFSEAGFPPGVLNVIQGGKEVVDQLLVSKKIQAISFVGSTSVAQHVYQTGVQHGKRVQAFGGAKNHGVVMPDVDVEQVADSIVGAAYGSAGERCMAISVVVVVGDAIADQLVQKMQKKINTLEVGNGNDPKIDMGPLITREHLDRVKNYIQAGEDEGAQLILDGRSFSSESTGYFLGPTLFDHVRPDMRIYQEEIFGPILCVVRVHDLSQAIDLINKHKYGNGVAIFTRDGSVARQFVNKIQVGMIGVNIPIPVPAAYYSFGGWKSSRFGDTQMHGIESIRFFTNLKTVSVRWPKEEKNTSYFSMPVHHE